MTLETFQAVKFGGSKAKSYHRHAFESVTYKTGGGYWTRSDEFCEYPLLEKLHFHVALEEVRVTELLSY